ncbi:MAG: class I SAM-dependent methyltransferase [Alphaproteobacteria bacterium]
MTTSPAGPGTDVFRFLRNWLNKPAITGAVAPSGRALCRAMVRDARPENGLPVLELGPGTGPVTRALVARGYDPERIVAVEFNPEFASLLVERFRGLNVVEGDAYDLAATLPPGLSGPFGAAISSLPLLNRPQADRERFIEAALDRLAPGGALIQFSYGMKPPVPAIAGRFDVSRQAFVALNVPPARVWRYSRAG